MLEAIKRALFRPTPTSAAAAPSTRPGAHELPVAACALLLELAHADDEFSGEERRHIQEALARHFGLGAEAAAELMTLAQDRLGQATDLHQFTSVIAKQYDEGQRMVLAEVLWRVVYADGKLSQHESYLMRKLANLLDLRPGYLAEARKRVLPQGSEPL
jgi:uncharacterized tellurite resistance protein B-like protein